jgi:hypothetical protein
MRFFPSYKQVVALIRKKEVVLPVVALIAVALPLLWVRQAYSPRHKIPLFHQTQTKNQKTKQVAPSPSVSKPESNTSAQQAVNFNHLSVISTIFWVGESASGDNGGISNKASAWDEHWQDHFGGVDNPKRRNGYFPADFVPKENPFYVALPYSDLTGSGRRKATAVNCPLYSQFKGQPFSWCKNSWVALRHTGKIVYAQWEDVGPIEEDDFSYVFGASVPKNTRDAGAGIDVSPAIAILLGLGDVDHLDWSFVDTNVVAGGVWNQIVTTNMGDSL